MSVPSFGSVLVRDALVARILDAPEGTIGISAPAGCGKSVLASQVATSEVFEAAIWVDCSWVTDSSTQLSSAVCAALDGRVPGMVVDSGCTIAPEARRETWSDALERLRSCSGKRLCFVLDSLNVLVKKSDVLPLNLLMSQVAGPGSRLIVTTRKWSEEFDTPSGLYLTTRDDLRITSGEAESLAAVVGLSEEHAGRIRTIHATCQGHAALFVVMLRHLNSEGELPAVDLDGADRMSDILNRIIRAQLEERDLRTLRLSALLQSASIVDVVPVVGPEAELILQRIAHALPLLRLEGRGLSSSFSVHDILATLVIAQLRTHAGSPGNHVVNDALRILDATGRLERLFGVLEALGDSNLLQEWLLKRGRDLLSVGGLRALEQSFDCLSVADVIREPALLLLQARMLSERGCIEAAVNKARVAQELATCDDNRLLRHDALMVQTRLHLDVHRLDRVRDCIRQALDEGIPAERSAGLGLLHGYMAVSLIACGAHEEAAEYRQLAIGSMRNSGGAETRARVGICLSSMDGLMLGRWDLAERHTRRAMAIHGLATLLRAQLIGNASHCLLELGYIERAREAADSVVEMCSMHGLEALGCTFASNVALCMAADGQYAEADRVQEIGEVRQRDFGNSGAVCVGLSYQCQWLLAAGDTERALSVAERGLELAVDFPVEYSRIMARLNMPAALLAIGDVGAASRMATQVGARAGSIGFMTVALAADLIGAECAKRMGVDDVDRAWANHAEYIATGSMNWRLAMMIRAFPGMLITLLEHGIGDAIPRRCLKLILPENWVAIVAVADNHLPEVKMLMKRAGVALPAQSIPVLQVRMFGRLEVRLGDRTVAKRDWRKRRARLMLAMLVLEQGNEIARDRISEHLWPEADVERATNNFYVAWSAMKNAIIPGADKLTKLPYLESSHGLCRAVMTYIDADVSEFRELLSAIRNAQQHADLARLKAKCQRLAEVYKGELLPGDLYDDWFASARDKYRREFGDAMRIGASSLIEAGQPDGCVALLRKGVEADPWREDLYQLLLRAHISSGQRGAAIDVYLSCRSRLADDLGLDPSAETLRLYEEVLAMEECETGYGSDSLEESS